MATEVVAHIAGSIWKLEKQVGDPVEAGEAVVILESMKMEVPIEAPASGRVIAIHCQPGETIDEDAVLATIETP